MPPFHPHFAALVLTGLVGGLSGCDGADSSPIAPDPAGTTAPETTGVPDEATGMFAVPLVDLEGRTTSLASHAGRPMLIEVWATWCGPCRKVRSVIKECLSEVSNFDGGVGADHDHTALLCVDTQRFPVYVVDF